MPIFEFNGAGNNTDSASITFTDQSVPFTLSTTGNTAPNTITRSETLNNGQLTISDFGGGNAPFTLEITAGAASTVFDGNNLVLDVGSSFSGAWNVTFVATGGGANVVQAVTGANQVINLGTTATNFSSIVFTPTGNGFLTVDSLNASIVCYLEGTGIATPMGDVAVQDLRPGDIVMTADGSETTVKWVGEQPVQTRLTHPARVNPICLTAGSIADNVPARDLFVSPDHAIAIDGALYNASTLVNGTSIYMVAKMPLDGFTYYHVETDAHEVILAEGCPAESYVDLDGSASFVNGDLRADAPRITEMDMPRITSKRLVSAELQNQLAAREEITAFKAVRAA